MVGVGEFVLVFPDELLFPHVPGYCHARDCPWQKAEINGLSFVPFVFRMDFQMACFGHSLSAQPGGISIFQWHWIKRSRATKAAPKLHAGIEME